MSPNTFIFFLILLKMAVGIIAKSIESSTNVLCYVCDESLSITFKSTINKTKSDFEFKDDLALSGARPCYRHGAYSVFCYPTYGKKDENPGQDCQTHLSILPPPKTKESCQVQIYDNAKKLQDILTISKNGSIASTNGSWYALPKLDQTTLNYAIIKRNPSKTNFEGRYLILLDVHLL